MYDNQSHRVIRIKELVNLLSLSRSTVYAKLDKRSSRYDPSFPRPIKLSTMAVGWLHSDVYDWISKVKKSA